VRKDDAAGRIDRRKHDEDIAERVIGGIRSSIRHTTVPDEVDAANHHPRRPIRPARPPRKR
jgi:hypothetical protein